MCLFQFGFSQGVCPVVGLLGHMILFFLVFFFLRNLHIVLYSSCINLYFHEQCKRVCFSSHTPQHLFVDFCMMGILTSVILCYVLRDEINVDFKLQYQNEIGFCISNHSFPEISSCIPLIKHVPFLFPHTSNAKEIDT